MYKLVNYLKTVDRPNQVLIFYLFTALVSFIWTTPLFLVLITFFPTIFLLKISRNNFLAVLPILGMLNTAFLVITAAFSELIGAPITPSTLVIFNILATVGIFYAVKRDYVQQVSLRIQDSKLIYFLCGIFFLALISRVFSTIGVSVPILHDPISHAFWAHEITTTQAISYFYPPGLHVLIAFFAESLSINHALSTHYVSNFLNAFSVLSWSVVAYFITKNRTFSVLVAILMFIAPYPAVLYFMSGKNAFLAAVAYIPLAFLFLCRFIKNSNWLNSSLLAVSLLVLFFIHYPTFGYVLGFAGVVLVAAGVKKLLSKDNYKNYAVYLGAVTFLVATIALGWLVHTRTQYVEKYESKVQLEENSSENSRSVIEDTAISIEPLNAFKTTYREFKLRSDNFSTLYFPLTLASLLSIPFVFRKFTYLSIPIFALVIFSIPYVINLLSIQGVAVIRGTGVQLVFQVFVLSVSALGSFLFSKITLDKKRAATLAFATVAVLLCATYTTYAVFSRKSNALPVVNNHDIAAFEWINNNIDESTLFLNNAQQSTQRTKIIFSKDAGAWLPIYTGNPVTMPFHEGQFLNQETHDNYAIYIQLNDNFRTAVCKLKEKEVDYYYHDLQTPYGPPLNVVETAPNNVFERVYGNTGAEVYKINHDKLCS